MTTFASDGSTVTPAPTQTAPAAAPVAPTPFNNGGVPESSTTMVNNTGQPIQVTSQPPAPAPEPVPPAAEIATVEATPDMQSPQLDVGWPHDWLEFQGDTLAIRKPQQSAVVGLSLASGKYVPADVNGDITGLFIVQLLGPESYGRVMWRMISPDDPTYTVETIGELVRTIVELAAADWKTGADQDVSKAG